MIYPEKGPGYAWVWVGEWHSAAGLAPKASIEGARYSPQAFMGDFPGADLTALEEMARCALQMREGSQLALLTPPASELPDRDLVSAAYALTKQLLTREKPSIARIAPQIIRVLSLDPEGAHQLLRNCFFDACHALRLSPSDPSLRLADLKGALSAIDRNASSYWLDPEERLDRAVRGAVRNFGRSKSRELAAGIRRKLQRMPRPHIVDDGYRHRNGWAEFAAWIPTGDWTEREGPHWMLLLEPLVRTSLEKLKAEEASLLTLASSDLRDDYYDIDSEANDCSVEGMRDLVLEALAEMAED